jgi:TolB-like protein/Flp pilus assembly protein TadD
MKKETRFLVHLTCCYIFLALSLPGIVTAAQEMRTALVIGNSAYSAGPLKNPVNDAADMSAMLKNLGFSVTLKKEATLQQMDEAIEAFGNSLKKGGVGLFYYAGHGVQVNGTNYLIPIGAKINKETDVKYQAVDANKILDEMANANNGLNIIILDACRDNPFARSFRNATRGLAIVSSAPSGTFISYSTSPGSVARDGKARNSPYTAALLQYMQAPGLTISDVFVNVRAKVKKETGQVPWELSSMEGRFYFKPQGSKQSNLSDITPPVAQMEVASKEKMALPLPDVPSIAVLPFVNMSEDPKQEFFCDGMTEEIITALSKVPRLLVISRQSTFSFKGKSVNVKQVSEELGVRYVLEGSVRRSGNRVRITAQFIDALTGNHLWAERYDYDLKDIFALQDEITMKVLTAIQVKLMGKEGAAGNGKYYRGEKGLDCYLKIMEAGGIRLRFNVEANKLARRMVEEAISMCPENPMAHVALSWVYRTDVVLGNTKSREETIEKGIELAQKALAIDDSIAGAHSVLCYLYLDKREYDKAIAEGERAVALDPGGAGALNSYANSLRAAGRPEEAIPFYQKAIRLTPVGSSVLYRDFGGALRTTKRFDEAVSALNKAIQLEPDDILAHLQLTFTYVRMGREKEARAEAAEVLRIDPKFSFDKYGMIPSETMIEGLRKAGLK